MDWFLYDNSVRLERVKKLHFGKALRFNCGITQYVFVRKKLRPLVLMYISIA